jgi:hypothetical protein
VSLVHGINGALVWAVDASEPNTGVYVTNIYKMVIRKKRPMGDVTPFKWNSREWVPGQYEWSADLHGYMPTNQDPGFFNRLGAQAQLKTSSGDGDKWAGTVWIESCRIDVTVDDATRFVFTVKGSGDITGTF